MKLRFLVFSLSFLVAVCWADELLYDDSEEGVHWAFLVSGCQLWQDYSVQADICHAYHVMRRHGIPKERIIVMMYDNIAYNEENPTPGIIINHPNGSDVYGGVVIDYRANDITPANFLAILRGDEEAVRGIGSGRVIKSGPKDHIFVDFEDHGGAGLLFFPNHLFLTATELLDTITAMHEQKKYAKMLLYVMSCLSGSMFEDILPKNVSVFALTSSNTTAFSWPCYKHPKVDVYISSEFGVRWMEDSDREDLTKETLHEQYLIAKNLTRHSPVSKYGNLTISKLPVDDFQGDGTGPQPKPIILPYVPCAVEMVQLHLRHLNKLHKDLMASTNSSETRKIRDEIFELLQLYREVDKTMKSIVSMATQNEHTTQQIIDGYKRPLRNRKCYEPAVKLFYKNCYKVGQNDYARAQLYILVNLCEEGVDGETILHAIAAVCDA